MILKFDGTPIDLKGIYRGQSIFFVGSGPSLTDKDLSFLSAPGVMSFSVNNAPIGLSFSPHFWACMDDPKSFHANIWNNPTICKFASSEYRLSGYFIQENVKNRNLICNLSNIYFFNKKFGFNHNSFLFEDEVCCGNVKGIKDSIGQKGCRSVMLAAFKIMYYLGFSRIFLIGCDFNMEHDDKKDGKGKTYSFSQYKHPGGVLTNNFAYKILDKRFAALNPVLKERGTLVFNCTPKSNLTAFPSMPLEEAIQSITSKFETNPQTKGYYGGKENLNRFGW